jgi:CheY-like chemotaxis protein
MVSAAGHRRASAQRPVTGHRRKGTAGPRSLSVEWSFLRSCRRPAHPTTAEPSAPRSRTALPRATADAHFGVVLLRSVPRGAVPRSSTGDQTHAHAVLVVDDDPECLDALTFYLESSGFVVEGALGGEAALARLRAGELPCVVITDLAMPIVDGWEVVAAMQADATLATVPIIMTSGFPQHVSRALVAGVRAYLPKPVDPEHLAATVARYCRRSGPS